MQQHADEFHPRLPTQESPTVNCKNQAVDQDVHGPIHAKTTRRATHVINTYHMPTKCQAPGWAGVTVVSETSLCLRARTSLCASAENRVWKDTRRERAGATARPAGGLGEGGRMAGRWKGSFHSFRYMLYHFRFYNVNGLLYHV